MNQKIENNEAIRKAYSELDKAFDDMKLQRVAIQIFRDLPELFVVIDFEGRLIFWNEEWENVFGFDPSELHRKFLFSFVAEEDKERTVEAFKNVRNNKSGKLDRPFRNRYLTKEGEKILVQWNDKNPVADGYIVATAKVIKT